MPLCHAAQHLHIYILINGVICYIMGEKRSIWFQISVITKHSFASSAPAFQPSYRAAVVCSSITIFNARAIVLFSSASAHEDQPPVSTDGISLFLHDWILCSSNSRFLP